MFLSGRIAYPSLTLTTWGKCPFKISDLRLIDSRTVEIVGREKASDCGSAVLRHRTSARIDPHLLPTFVQETQVVVSSRSPAYSIDADLVIGLA